MKNIINKDIIITVTGVNDDEYVSLTDIARKKSKRAKRCCKKLVKA